MLQAKEFKLLLSDLLLQRFYRGESARYTANQ